MQKNAIIKEVIRIVRKYIATKNQIVLFGSWARGDALPVSDIDIGILGENKIPWDVMTNILQEVESIPTLRNIDIVDLRTKSEQFRQNVLKNSKVLARM